MAYKTLLLKQAAGKAPGIWGFGMFAGLIANVLIILLLAVIVYWLLKGGRKKPEKPLDTLKMRLARGEIDETEYNRIKKLIEE